eukprot:TRINITY_DN4261_c1_g1_i2.p1 TRINITY_DN4261_c1_g1~~TRINITY_DN4261_c1_g1_i2.p1  ORF type:complete len:519 (+),score=141.56 TRINITY_DN4261_c1_g1_i2:70-1557(+)
MAFRMPVSALRCGVRGVVRTQRSSSTGWRLRPARWCSGAVQPPREEEIREELTRIFQQSSSEQQPDTPHRPRIPVTIITGFLGAGKTTLLNHVLKQPHGKKLGVIENEYGEVGVDDLLVPREKGEEEELFELNNGCVCCTVKGDLVRILGRLASRDTRLDGVVIETTGLANPVPIVQTFFQDPDVAAQYELDGVIAVVDAKHIERHLDAVPEGHVARSSEVGEAIAQVAFADRVLLNKTDLVDSGTLQRIAERLRTINGSAEIVPTQQSQVTAGHVLNVGGYDPEKIADSPVAHDHHHHHHGHHHSHGHGECTHGADGHCDNPHHSHSHRHDSSVHKTANEVGTVGLRHDGDMVPAAVRVWLDDVLERYGDGLFRHKGVLAVRGLDQKFVFQGVHDLSAGPAATDIRWDGAPRESRMIFIGKDLDRDFIEAGFEQCKAPDTLRFPVGTRVRCHVGGRTRAGVVAEQWDSAFGCGLTWPRIPSARVPVPGQAGHER